MNRNIGDEENTNGTENDVIHRWQNLQSIRSIARDLNLTRYKVTRILAKHAQGRSAEAAIENDVPPASLGPAPKPRTSKLDPFADQLTQLLERYPKITATRVFEELKRHGYGLFDPARTSSRAPTTHRAVRNRTGCASSNGLGHL